jgi:hypothetical protein
LAISKTVSSWSKKIREDSLAVLWIKVDRTRQANPEPQIVSSLWRVLLGSILFERLPKKVVEAFWQDSIGMWPNPRSFLRDPLKKAGVSALKGGPILNNLLAIAEGLGKIDVTTTATLPGISSERFEQAKAIAGITHSRPPITAATRVVERIFEKNTEDSRRNAELLIARAVGVDRTARAYAGLIAIG